MKARVRSGSSERVQVGSIRRGAPRLGEHDAELIEGKLATS